MQPASDQISLLQVLVSFLSGLAGGVALIGVRAWWETKTAKANRRREALEALLRVSVAPLSAQVGGMFLIPQSALWKKQQWEGRDVWWPPAYRLAAELTNRWAGEWSIRVQDEQIDSLVQEVSRIALATELDALRGRKKGFLSSAAGLNDRIEELRVATRQALGEERSD